MPVSEFARLVSLACHDLRTPLATVGGFARTLERVGTLDEQQARYVEMIRAATDQLSQLLDSLAVVARIEAGRYEPALQRADTLELARAVAERVEGAAASGDGSPVEVDAAAAEDALAALATAATRHGGLDAIRLDAEGPAIALSPVGDDVAPILLGRDLRDFGAAVAERVIAAGGGSVGVDGDRLVVRLPTGAGAPTAGGATGAGP